ncbi:CBS sensor hybrid histidine kinase [Desulfatibacillum aliphaticivorans]|uniref:histidine kinase n=1 Tax=Desulfatibacillum aliphaticivorans TaxID=218208 RepID=B8FGP3_DESAL|nr:ATP-binding protein [Desulfatibacillum aliphaticivorans]ACL05273.1 CBS sensor hybrid histidine kinase [Desulfatibacillum aliphaticivorans]
MKAKYLVQDSYPVASPLDGTDSVKDIILQTGYIVVLEGNTYRGLLTPQDIVKFPKNLILDCLQERPAIDINQYIDSIMVQMKDGGFDVLPVFSSDGFKGVVVQTQIAEFLSDYNQSLEKTVQQKTQELLKVNEQLRKEIKDREVAEEENSELLKRIHHSEKVAAIGNLAAGIAHDFNNILSPIVGFSEMAMCDAKQGSSLWNNLHEIYVAGNRAKEIIKQILRFARHSEGFVEPIQLKSILDEGLKLIQSSFPSSITIQQSVQTDAYIKADATMIHQVYMNLCTNAFHAMEEKGGVLDIQARNTCFFHDSEFIPQGVIPGEYVELRISDTGIGILPDNLKCVFDPYFTTKSVDKGTGMGLSIVYGIVKGYNGAIHIESQPGQGTTVFLYLPVTKQEDFKRADLQIHMQKGHESILFVDDEKAITNLFKQSLEKAGYKVAVYTNPIIALTSLKSQPGAFDLVITDMTMPEMTGDVLAFEIRRIRQDIPVILCTGYSQMLSDKTIKVLGLNAVLNKPVLSSELTRIIRQVLDG